MAEPAKSVLEFLEQMRKEREELNMLIYGLERRLGIHTQEDQPSDATSSPKVRVSIESVPVGFFHNMSQPRAAEKLLRLNPAQTLTTQEIMEAFRKSGMKTSTSKNALNMLYTALKRNAKFERVAGKAWGLTEWYPEGRQKSEQKNETKRPPKNGKTSELRMEGGDSEGA